MNGPLREPFLKFLDLREKAEKGDSDSQNELGKLYARGDGVIKDGHIAVKWFSMAADKGCAKACYNMGRCYVSGFGVNKDVAKAEEFFRKAEELGYKHEPKKERKRK